MELNKSAKFTLLLEKPITGKQKNGDPWQLYPVKNESGNELSFFAPDDIHTIMAEHKLKTGDEFILTRVENGSKGSSKLEVSIIGKDSSTAPESDNLKELMIRSMRDAAAIAAEAPEFRFGSSDVRAIANSLFIARS